MPVVFQKNNRPSEKSISNSSFLKIDFSRKVQFIDYVPIEKPGCVRFFTCCLSISEK